MAAHGTLDLIFTSLLFEEELWSPIKNPTNMSHRFIAQIKQQRYFRHVQKAYFLVHQPPPVRIVNINTGIGFQGHAVQRAAWMTFHPDYADGDRLLNTSCTSSVLDSFELWTAEKGNWGGAFAMPDKVSRVFL